MFKNATAIGLISLFCVSGITHAQSSPPVAQKSESPRRVPPAYVSVFEGYKPYGDEKLVDWKEANRQVELRGGWRQYSKEAQEPEPKPVTSTPGPSQAMDRIEPKPKP